MLGAVEIEDFVLRLVEAKFNAEGVEAWTRRREGARGSPSCPTEESFAPLGLVESLHVDEAGRHRNSGALAGNNSADSPQDDRESGACLPFKVYHSG